MKYTLITGLCLTALFATACGDDDSATTSDSGTASSSATTTTGATGGSGGGAAAGGMAASGGAGGGSAAGGNGGAGGQACEPPAGMFDNQGCLTFDGGNAICMGFDNAVCNAAIACGLSTGDLGQCHINCSQGAVVGECYTQEDVDCVYRAAVCDGVCADLSACHWPFF